MSEEKRVIELTEEDLEKVSGGTDVTVFIFYLCTHCGNGWFSGKITSPAYKDIPGYELEQNVTKTCPKCGKDNCNRYITTSNGGNESVCLELGIKNNNF